MKERPILFSAPMVRALLDGSKTQTRRVCKPATTLSAVVEVPDPMERGQVYNGSHFGDEDGAVQFACPYGGIGDRLWVRENFCPIYPQDPHYNNGRPIEYDYQATYQHGYRLGDLIGKKKKWKPSIHMPRHASRITLQITSVRVERLQDISEADAIAEGVRNSLHLPGGRFARENFEHLWWTINGDGSWESNPWVWVIEFKRVEGGAP